MSRPNLHNPSPPKRPEPTTQAPPLRHLPSPSSPLQEGTVSESARARRLSRGIFPQMLGDVPRPELDHVAAWVGHVGSPPTAVKPIPTVVVVEHCVAMLSDPLQDGGVRLGRETHRVVDVDAAAAAAQPDLRPPETNAGPVAGHHPHRLVGPPLDHRESKDLGVELFRRGEVALLQSDLAHATHRHHALGLRHPRLITRAMSLFASRSAIASRLSYCFLPRASPTSTFAWLREK